MRAVAIGLGLCLALASPAPAQESPAPAVVVAPAEVVDLRAGLDLTGRLKAIQKAEIRARVEGTLEEVGATEGAQVSSGDLLFRLEDTIYAAEVRQIEGSIASAAAEQTLAEIERDRQAQLVARDAVAQTVLDQAEANLGKAVGEVERLEAARAIAEQNLAYTRITAPFDGVMGLSAVDVGALVGPETGALTTLTRLDPMTAEFAVPTAEYLRFRRRVRAGEATREASVTLSLPDGSTYEHAGDIDFVDAAVAQGTDTVTLRAVFPNPDRLLPDGALVGVTLRQAEPQMVLTVPQRAVQRDQLGSFVMTVGDDGTVARRRVEVARTDRGLSVIAEGLAEGERVITDGVNKVRPGITVDAAPAGDD